MKKQLIAYKEEIESMKKMETHLTVENYQKLVNDFNQLYDHYKLHKTTSKKLKQELLQSNHREKTFLNLLKKTQEFGSQAQQLEKEYDKLYKKGEEEFNLSNVQKLIEVPAAQQLGGKLKFPELDFSLIYSQQNNQGDGDSTSTNHADTSQTNEENNDALSTGKEKSTDYINPEIKLPN